MDDIPCRPKTTCKDGRTKQHPPPPPPPRAGKEQYSNSSGSSLDWGLVTLKFANKVDDADDDTDDDDDDVVLGYEYVSNPMKMKNKPKDNRCIGRKATSMRNHPHQHCEHDGSERDGDIGAELHCGNKGRKQRDMCSARGGTVGANKGPFGSSGNGCFESMDLNIDTTGLRAPPLTDQ